MFKQSEVSDILGLNDDVILFYFFNIILLNLGQKSNNSISIFFYDYFIDTDTI